MPIIVAALLFGPSVALGVLGGLCYAGLFAWLRARRSRVSGEPGGGEPGGDDSKE